MSAKQANKNLPAIIVVVVVLLGGVVALNINTFGGSIRSGSTSRGYRLQAHPPVPSDMGQMAKHAVEVRPSSGSGKFEPPVTNLGRDPFFPTQAQPRPVVKTRSGSHSSGKRTRKAIKPLVCSAIMLGGRSPMAIINGEGRHPGDKIRGMILKSIDADGVTFQKSDGSRKHLSVGIKEDKNQNYMVVTRTRELDHQGSTSLVKQ